MCECSRLDPSASPVNRQLNIPGFSFASFASHLHHTSPLNT
jgi:hypothetical protein